MKMRMCFPCWIGPHTEPEILEFQKVHFIKVRNMPFCAPQRLAPESQFNNLKSADLGHLNALFGFFQTILLTLGAIFCGAQNVVFDFDGMHILEFRIRVLKTWKLPNVYQNCWCTKIASPQNLPFWKPSVLIPSWVPKNHPNVYQNRWCTKLAKFENSQNSPFWNPSVLILLCVLLIYGHDDCNRRVPRSPKGPMLIPHSLSCFPTYLLTYLLTLVQLKSLQKVSAATMAQLPGYQKGGIPKLTSRYGRWIWIRGTK